MTKSLFILVLFVLNLTVFAQERKKNDVEIKSLKLAKHELKFGILKPVLNEAVEVTYEYVATHKLGFGLAILFNTDKTNSFQEDFAVTPFARFYFQDPTKQSGNGLFLEGFGKYIEGRYTGLNESSIPYTSTSLGLGAGYKWLFKTGLIIEPVVGFSKTLAPKDSAAPGGGLRGDVALGYRF